MAKIDVRKQNPERYALVKMKQEKMRDKLNTEITVSLECPFCYHKAGRIFQGAHGAIECKCDNCGEIFIFPPVAFSRAR